MPGAARAEMAGTTIPALPWNNLHGRRRASGSSPGGPLRAACAVLSPMTPPPMIRMCLGMGRLGVGFLGEQRCAEVRSARTGWQLLAPGPECGSSNRGDIGAGACQRAIQFAVNRRVMFILPLLI